MVAMVAMVAGDIGTETLVDSRATEKGNIDVFPQKNIVSYTQNIVGNCLGYFCSVDFYFEILFRFRWFLFLCLVSGHVQVQNGVFPG